MEFFGLDIGSRSIKIAQVKEEKNGEMKLLAIGRAPTPPKGMSSEAEVDLVAMATIIKKLLNDTKISTRNVVVSLPELKVATKVLTVPKMKDQELMNALKFEAEAFVPFPIDEANLDFQIISEGKEEMVVTLAAAPKRLVDKYLKVFSLADIFPQALEAEMSALVRAVIPLDFPPSLLVDFGANVCNMAVVENGYVSLTRSIPTAGQAFTRALATDLSLEESQAEEYKKTFGLGKEMENKIQKSLLPILEVAALEMKKITQSYMTQKKEDLKKVILAGGSAGLPEMAPLLAQRLGLEVVLANPFFKLVFDKNKFPGLAKEGAIFSIAIGLAQRKI